MSDIDDCEIHACSTQLRTIRVVAADRIGMKDSPRYAMALRARFPRSDDPLVARGVWREHDTAVVAVCARCCSERDGFVKSEYPRWLETHELAG